MARTVARSRFLISVPFWWQTGTRFGARSTYVALAAALTVTALVLRLVRLDGEPLWLDEGYTLLFSRLPLGRLLLVGGAHEHPPLYYLLVHAVLGVHDSYLVPRVISVICGTLSVPVLFALGKRMFGLLAACVAAGLLAFSPFHLWFSQDGRGYELAGLLVLLSYLFLFSALDTPRRALWVLYGLSTALSMYAEYTTLLVLIPQAVLLLRARERGLTRSLLLAWTGAAIAFLPWMGTLVLDAASIAGSYWIPAPDVKAVANTGLEFMGLMTPCASPPCTGREFSLPLLAGHEILVAGLLFASVLAAGFAALRVRDATLATLALWMLCPFALILLISIRWSLYLDRVFLDATFPMYLLLAAGVSNVVRRPWKWVAGAAALLIAAASVAGLQSDYAGGANPDWRSAARDFYAAYRPGQSVVFNPGVLRSVVSAYLPAHWHATSEVPLWSRSYVDVPGWPSNASGPLHPSPEERSMIEARLRERQLAEAALGHARVWLITYDYSGINDTRRWFSLHGFQLALSEMYGGDTRIELWSRTGPRTFGTAMYEDTFDRGWSRSGDLKVTGASATVLGHGALTRSFVVNPGGAYSVNVDYRGVPPAHPLVELRTFDAGGKALAVFPRTQWYDWPVTGVWLSQPFGFVAPPGASRAVVSLTNAWGMSSWRHVVVYRER